MTLSRFLLNFYCSWLRLPLDGDTVGVSLPVTTSSISNLLKLLGSGIALSSSREELEDIRTTAEILNISLANCQIGSKKKKSESVKQPKREKTEGRFKCELCSYQGRDKYRLTRHRKTHSKLLKSNPSNIGQDSFEGSEALQCHSTSGDTANEDRAAIKEENRER